MPLTDLDCKNAKARKSPVKLSDSGGLFLLVQPSGSRLWRLAYRWAGKQKSLALGVYPAVSLKDARAGRERAKGQLSNGIDPGEQRKRDKRQAAIAATNTFAAVAAEWFHARKDGWTDGYSTRIWSRLEADIMPAIGSKPIEKIEPPELLDAIRTVEKRGAVVLAKRLLQVSGQIFRYAIASGRAQRDPSQDLRGALKSPGAANHRSSIKAGELGDFLRTLDAYPGQRTTQLALKLVVHTFLRTNEVRFGRWAEIERASDGQLQWRIPAARMKARAEHIVPVTSQVADILDELRSLAGKSELLLPAPTNEGVISQNTLIYGLYRMGYHSRATVHGFRSTASTILNENGFNRDWIERQLAHVERNDVRAAYNTAEWLADRRKMMEWWSNYLDAARAEKEAAVAT
ncbi:integrase arm-type DNA-binding domain-containing protein [Mesorhizobium sp. M0041]|uniref:tyrosine-type recombinase/integrase n=1 Tax=Mesorhizobium sp. M0041 TaxID=2956856 RepID=UPI003337F16E